VPGRQLQLGHPLPPADFELCLEVHDAGLAGQAYDIDDCQPRVRADVAGPGSALLPHPVAGQRRAPDAPLPLSTWQGSPRSWKATRHRDPPHLNHVHFETPGSARQWPEGGCASWCPWPRRQNCDSQTGHGLGSFRSCHGSHVVGQSRGSARSRPTKRCIPGLYAGACRPPNYGEAAALWKQDAHRTGRWKRPHCARKADDWIVHAGGIRRDTPCSNWTLRASAAVPYRGHALAIQPASA
jgi:hypothetical protein